MLKIVKRNYLILIVRSAMTKTLPFGIFVVSAIVLSFISVADINLLIGVGILLIILGSLIVKDRQDYWDVLFEYMGNKTAMTAMLLWLVVGVYGCILNAGHIADGLTWLAGYFHLNGSQYTVVVFLFSGLFAISTGSGFGTISAMSLTLFPAGVEIGASPAFLGGAILSGAALGDSISPVSDTAVIAAVTQSYDNSDKTAEISGTILHRLPYVAVAALLTIILFFLLGGLLYSYPAHSATHLDGVGAEGLVMLIPTILIIGLSLCRVNIYVSLLAGIFLATFLGLGMHLFQLEQLLTVSEGSVDGCIIRGISGMANVAILLMVVVSLSGLVIQSGGMDIITRWFNERCAHSGRRAEIVIFLMVVLAGCLIAAVNTIANICIAPFVNKLGTQSHLHPYRRSTLLATGICTFPFILPYGGCVLLLQKGISASGSTVSLGATDVLLTAVYPWTLFVVMLFVCVTGLGKNKDEKTDTADN